MPKVAMLAGPTPTPQAANTLLFDKMFETLGQMEGMRRQKILNTNILEVLRRGGTPEEQRMGIAEAVRAANQPEFSQGPAGWLERLSAPFAPQVGQGMMGAITQQAIKPQPKTEIQKLTDEGYTPEESKMIRDISHGLKPRASSRLTYDKRTEIEKLDFLSNLKRRAEGQYFGIESGNVEPRDPKLLDWTLRELNKLPAYRQTEPTEGKPTRQTEPIESEAQPATTDLLNLGEQAGPWLGTPSPTKKGRHFTDLEAKQLHKDESELRSIMNRLKKEGNTKLLNAIRELWLAYMNETGGRSANEILEFDELKPYRK